MKEFMARLRFHFPIRFKFLLIQLVVVTAAVGVITFTMARLFHADKTTYISDLTSVIALQTAEETNATLRAYQDKLQIFARIMAERTIPPERKAALLKNLFEDFREFVLISQYEGGTEKNSVYDAKSLKESGLTREQFTAYRRTHPLPLDIIRERGVFIENSSIHGTFPVMTIAVAQPALDGGNPGIIVAVARLEGLINMAGRSKVFETFLIDRAGVFLAHSDAAKVANQEKPTGLPKLNDLIGAGSLGTSVEYTQKGVATIGGFARVEIGDIIAGVQIPKATAYLSTRELLRSLLWVALALLATAALLSIFWSSRLTRPLQKLSLAAGVVGRGDFDIHVEPESLDEIGSLAESFNKMASELKFREEALGAAHHQLIQSEKMAAFGQLGAGIAHEVKNPLAGILGYAQMSLRKIQEGDPLKNNLIIIERETKRCTGIIDNLMKFARQEKVSMTETNINSVVEDAMTIVDHQLSLKGIKLEKDLAPTLPCFMGNGNQIQQVLMNLMINAQQAMEGTPGTVRLSTALIDSSQIEIRVSDAGTGMPAEISTKIFEPFFTTKAAGKGTGLGLSVSYGIVKDHKGEIRVESELGLGTTFIITLPVIGFDAQITTESEES